MFRSIAEVKTKQPSVSLMVGQRSDIYVSPVEWNEAALRGRVGRYNQAKIVIGQIKQEIEKRGVE